MDIPRAVQWRHHSQTLVVAAARTPCTQRPAVENSGVH